MNIVAPKKLSRDDIIDWSYGDNLFYQPATFMASWAVKSTGKIREDLLIAIDYEYWLRLMKEGPFIVSPHILAEATIHPESKTQTHRAKIISEQVQIMFEQGYPAQARLVIEQLCNRLTSIENRVEKAKKIIPYRFIKPLLKKIGF